MKVSAENHFFAFSKGNKPAVSVPSGGEVILETMDCFANQLQTKDDKLGSIDWERVNPATGPVFVEGAQPGDTLKVSILKIQLGKQAVMATGENFGVLGDRMKGMFTRIVPVSGGKAVFNDKISLPLKVMIGVIGVAPNGAAVNCGTPGSHGGNMDNTMIGEGTVLYFPVSAPGALFGAGDVHAVMGDGEVGVSGAEIPAELTLKLEVIRGMPLKNPVLETKDAIVTIASDESIETAISAAVHDMTDLLQAKLDTGPTVGCHIPLETPDLSMLLSAAGDVQICQVVDPLKTVRFVFPKWILEKYHG